MTNEERATLYHLLAHCFSYPNVYLPESLKGLLGELRIASWGSDSCGRPVLPMAPFVRALASLDANGIDLLQQEHRRLFGYESSTGVCPACACAYRPDSAIESLRQDAQQMYAAWGIVCAPERAVQLETQLEFMAYLYRQEQKEEAVVTAREEFLYKQALVWLLRFSAAVEKNSQIDFYCRAARLMAVFLKMEAIAMF